MVRALFFILCTVGPLCVRADSIDHNKQVQVYILAGQSNMEGKGSPVPIAWQCNMESLKDRWTPLIENGDHANFFKTFQESVTKDKKNPVFKWATRKDTWVSYHNKHGYLKPGFSDRRDNIGPEVSFGHIMGNQSSAPILLIKTSWGGKSLGRDFRPPSRMYSTADFKTRWQQEVSSVEAANLRKLENFKKQTKKYNEDLAAGKKARKPREPSQKKTLSFEEYKSSHGVFYRQMMKEVKEALAKIKENHPDYKNQGYRLKGFVWFQGFNDQFNDEYRSNYKKNMVAFIRDIRQELSSPKMPFIIGQLGTNADRNGEYPKGRDGKFNGQADVRQGQWDAAQEKDFQGNVLCIRTAPLEDKEAAAIYYGPGSWKKDIEKWNKFGSDRPYHYLGSPWFYYKAGTSFAEGMLKLQK